MNRVLIISLCLAALPSWPQPPKLRSSGSVAGEVLDNEFKPLPGATVYGMPEEDMTHQIRAVTDHSGNFVLKNLPVGGVYLNAYKESDGYPYNFFSFFIAPGQRIPGKVQILADVTTSGVVIKLGAKAAYLDLDISNQSGDAVSADLLFDRLDVPGPYRRGSSSHESIMVPPVPFRLTVEANGYTRWHFGGQNWQGPDGLINLKSGEHMKLVVKLKLELSSTTSSPACACPENPDPKKRSGPKLVSFSREETSPARSFKTYSIVPTPPRLWEEWRTPNRIYIPVRPRRVSPVIKVMMNTTRKIKNRSFAIPAAATATPPKPNIAAMIATIRNTSAQ